VGVPIEKENETPFGPEMRGRKMGRKYPLSGVRGGAPAENGFLEI